MDRQHRARTLSLHLAHTWTASTGPEQCLYIWPIHGLPAQGQNSVSTSGPYMGRQHRASFGQAVLAHYWSRTAGPLGAMNYGPFRTQIWLARARPLIGQHWAICGHIVLAQSSYTLKAQFTLFYCCLRHDQHNPELFFVFNLCF